MEEVLKIYDAFGRIIIDKDLHTHTVYSHGKGSVLDNVKTAYDMGLKSIAITDHGIDHFIYGVSRKNLVKEKEDVEKARVQFPDMNILFGIESDIKGLNGRIDLKKEDFELFDIVLCGFHKPVWADKIGDYFKLFYNSYSHAVYKPTKGQIARNTKAYINTIEKNPIDIITHPNYHLKVNCYEVARACEDNGAVLELSSRHQDLTEKDYEDIFVKTNVMLAVNSDAHSLANIGNAEKAKDVVKEYGVDPKRIVNTAGVGFRFRSGYTISY